MSPEPRPPGFAPAKVNLALHVTGRRADGLHLLDSLVVFADLGDRVEAAPADDLSLRVEGPFAADVPAEGNLVLRAAGALRAARGVTAGAALTLRKALPVASGLGGGSSDAAAAMRVLSALWGVDVPSTGECLAVGADVPVCLAAAPARMRGVGERLDPVPRLPSMALALANPGRPVETRAVFAALAGALGEPMGPPPEAPSYDALLGWLAGRANHLAAPAARVEPAVGAVLARLGEAPGADLVRLSGSGATAFAICRDLAAARAVAASVAAAEPSWWTAAGGVQP